MTFGPQQQNLPQQSPQVKPGTIVTKNLIMSLNILQHSSMVLEQKMAQAREENPFLEIEEEQCCTTCGQILRDGFCHNCGTHSTLPRLGETADWADMPDHSNTSSDDEEYDPLARVSNGATLEDELLSILGSLVSGDHMEIAAALVGSLNDHGYLDISVEEMAESLGVTIEQVEDVLAVLQAQEPVGIGARDLRECLLIQLRWFREQGQPNLLAEQIVDGFLREVAERRFVEIGRELGTTSRHVRAAWDFIKANLNPFPAHEALRGPILRSSSNRGNTALVRPDVIIRRTETGFEAEIVESRRFRMGINASYRAILRQGANISESERNHLRKYMNQAQFFIDCVRQRWDTLKKITDELIAQQFDFLDRGVHFLRPLTRSELAEYVALHEATVSRATNEKYVLLPDGRTIAFDDFFNASLKAKETLRELIAAEDPRHPLSDEELAELLTERGMPVARRTVAKYREALKILPSRLR